MEGQWLPHQSDLCRDRSSARVKGMYGWTVNQLKCKMINETYYLFIITVNYEGIYSIHIGLKTVISLTHFPRNLRRFHAVSFTSFFFLFIHFVCLLPFYFCFCHSFLPFLHQSPSSELLIFRQFLTSYFLA